MEISAPRPKVLPKEAMVALEVSAPMTNPAQTIIVPEVMMVGNASFNVSMIAALRSAISFLIAI